MPIHTQEEFETYMINVLRYTAGAARTIARSATFHEGVFRGGNQIFGTFYRELTPHQRERLLHEFDDPEIVPDHIYSPALDDCVPSNNDYCARYRNRRR